MLTCKRIRALLTLSNTCNDPTGYHSTDPGNLMNVYGGKHSGLSVVSQNRQSCAMKGGYDEAAHLPRPRVARRNRLWSEPYELYARHAVRPTAIGPFRQRID